MKILRIIFFWVFLLIFLPMAWAEELELTMKEAVETGLAFNPSILAAKEALMASDYGIKSAKAAFGPAFSTQYGYTRLDERPQSMGNSAGTRDNWQLQFNVHQPLFTGFNLLTNYEKALLEKEQVASQIENAELQLAMAIQNSFMTLLQARENVRSAEDSLTRLKSHLQVNTAFYEVGLRPKLDVLQAEVDVAKAEQILVAAENAVNTQDAHLNTLLGKNVNESITYKGELEYIPIPVVLEDCLYQAAQKRPDLSIARQTVMLAQKDVTLAGVPYYPQVGADFNYGRAGEDLWVKGGKYHTPSEWNAQLGLKWTFFEWGKTYYGQQQAKKNVSRLEQEYYNLENEVAFEVKRAFLQTQEAEKRIAAAKQGLVAARESLRMATARYEAQVGTNTDVLDALAAQTASESNLNEALADYGRATVNLYGAMGLQTPDLMP